MVPRVSNEHGAFIVKFPEVKEDCMALQDKGASILRKFKNHSPKDSQMIVRNGLKFLTGHHKFSLFILYCVTVVKI